MSRALVKGRSRPVQQVGPLQQCGASRRRTSAANSRANRGLSAARAARVRASARAGVNEPWVRSHANTGLHSRGLLLRQTPAREGCGGEAPRYRRSPAVPRAGRRRGGHPRRPLSAAGTGPSAAVRQDSGASRAGRPRATGLSAMSLEKDVDRRIERIAGSLREIAPEPRRGQIVVDDVGPRARENRGCPAVAVGPAAWRPRRRRETPSAPVPAAGGGIGGPAGSSQEHHRQYRSMQVVGFDISTF